MGERGERSQFDAMQSQADLPGKLIYNRDARRICSAHYDHLSW